MNVIDGRGAVGLAMPVDRIGLRLRRRGGVVRRLGERAGRRGGRRSRPVPRAPRREGAGDEATRSTGCGRRRCAGRRRARRRERERCCGGTRWPPGAPVVAVVEQPRAGRQPATNGAPTGGHPRGVESAHTRGRTRCGARDGRQLRWAPDRLARSRRGADARPPGCVGWSAPAGAVGGPGADGRSRRDHRAADRRAVGRGPSRAGA